MGRMNQAYTGQQSSQPNCLGGSCALTDVCLELLQRPHCSEWRLQPLGCALLSQLWSLRKLQQERLSSPITYQGAAFLPAQSPCQECGGLAAAETKCVQVYGRPVCPARPCELSLSNRQGAASR